MSSIKVVDTGKYAQFFLDFVTFIYIFLQAINIGKCRKVPLIAMHTKHTVFMEEKSDDVALH